MECDTAVTTRTLAALMFTVAVMPSACSTPADQKGGAADTKAAAPAAAAPAPAASTPAAAGTAPAADEPIPPPTYEVALPEALRGLIDKPFTGDFDEMLKRRIIRVGVTFNRTFYFIDKGTQRGLSYEYGTLFEETLNKKLNTGNIKVHVVMLPMPRDVLLPALQQGKIDMVVAQLTVTPAREKLVDFTDPTRKDISEVVVTGPGAPPIGSLYDLAGKEVFVRRSSSYYESLTELNTKLKADGKPPVDIQLASESLEDDDLLEMVNAGLLPAIVVDNYLADFWKKVFPKLHVHSTVAVRTGGVLAAAIRKNSPQMKEALNKFIAKNGLGSTMYAILNKRYLQSTKFVKDATSEEERKKFMALVELFRKYGDKYKFDYLMMAAQGYQESRLNQNAKSAVGAIGVMQVMPETGKEQNVGDIHKVEPNVHAGVKYMRFLRNAFFEDQPMTDVDKALFTFAAYNAGPGRIRSLRAEAGKRGLDPNIWFGNVERIASERIGRETCTYVSNIYKYYVAYKLLQSESQRKKQAAAGTASSSGLR
jgi:membrane-bound lytic murein transglycosylase MltF